MDKEKSLTWDKGYHSGLESALETIETHPDIDTALEHLKNQIKEAKESINSETKKIS